MSPTDNNIEADIRQILEKVQPVSDLLEEVKRLREELRPLQIEAAKSLDHREKSCPRRHSNLNTVLIIALVTVLGASGYALAAYLTNSAELVKLRTDETIEKFPSE